MSRYRNRITRQQFVVGAVVLALILCNIVGFWFVRSGPPPNSFAGKVTVVDTSSLTVVDVKGHERVFMLLPDTVVLAGKNATSLSLLSIGTFVMVMTDTPGPRATTATKIRILSTDPFTRSHKTSTP